jgi:hypothetical protein
MSAMAWEGSTFGSREMGKSLQTESYSGVHGYSISGIPGLASRGPDKLREKANAYCGEECYVDR